MKYTTIYSGNNKIELFNSILGKETVKVNGKVVSSKYSFLGAEHIFEMHEDGITKSCKITFGTGMMGVTIDFFIDGNPVIETEKGGCASVFIYIGIIVFVLLLIDWLLY